MNIIVENLIAHIKSKQPNVSAGRAHTDPNTWGLSNLEDFAYSIQSVYKYLDERTYEEEAYELKKFYDIICKIVNESKKGSIINPGYLNHIDDLKRNKKELPT